MEVVTNETSERLDLLISILEYTERCLGGNVWRPLNKVRKALHCTNLLESLHLGLLRHDEGVVAGCDPTLDLVESGKLELAQQRQTKDDEDLAIQPLGSALQKPFGGET